MPIFTSPDLASKSRVVLVVGETAQDLGVLAHRVIGGPGGIDKGSMVSVVRHLTQQRSTAVDASPPGVVLANTGQLFWWPEGCRALNHASRLSVPASSAVSFGLLPDPERNDVPGHRNADEHVASVFRDVLGSSLREGARLSVVAVGDGSDAVKRFLNHEKNWAVWGPRLDCLALAGGMMGQDEIKVAGLREFLRKVSCPFESGHA